MDEYKSLRSIGCERVQGFLFSRPITKHELRRMLDAGELVPYTFD